MLFTRTVRCSRFTMFSE